MEDFGQDRISERSRIAVVYRKSRRRTPEPDEEVPDDEVPLPDPTISYSAWIKAIRPRWKKQRNVRLGGTGDAIMPSMFKGARVRTTQRWDIVQIRPSKIPGRFTLWVSVDAQLVPVPLRIPREFYLHLKTPPRDGLFQSEYYVFEKVARHLPRDLPCSNLYRVSVKEDIYQEIQEHFMDLMNDPNVDGVFERQV
jgi:DNA polymerase epsilon subunit 1